MRIFSQSASVFGVVSTMPSFVYTILTASKMLSEAGLGVLRISSLTDTTGVSSPHNAGARDAAGDGDDFDDEHVGVEMAITNSPAQVARRSRARMHIICGYLCAGAGRSERCPYSSS